MRRPKRQLDPACPIFVLSGRLLRLRGCADRVGSMLPAGLASSVPLAPSHRVHQSARQMGSRGGVRSSTLSHIY